MNRLSADRLLDTVAFCDPAGGKSNSQALKRVRARAAVVVVGIDPMSRIFVLHTWADRVTAGQLTERIFRIQADFKPRTFGIEANAMQALYGEMVAREARFKSLRIPLNPVKQPTNVDKDWRIRTALQPVVAAGRLFLQPHQYELRSELTTFPMNHLKDLIDALASAVSLLKKAVVPARRRDEREQLLAYLRATGAPAWYIEEQAQRDLAA